MKVKRKKDSTFDKDEEIWIIKQYHQGYSSTQVRRNFLKPLTLTDLWKICVYFGQNRNHSLSRLATELPNKKWKKCTGQKCLIKRNSEKQNLRKLVHGAPSSTTFKMSTCYLNTLYVYSKSLLSKCKYFHPFKETGCNILLLCVVMYLFSTQIL